MIEWLRRGGHSVSFLLNATSLDRDARARLEPVVDRLYTLEDRFADPGPAPWRWRLDDAARSIGSAIAQRLPAGRIRDAWSRRRRPYQIEQALAPQALLAATRALCLRHRPDAVIAEYVFAARCLSVVPPGTLKIIDTHDVFSRRKREVIRHGVDDPHHLSPRRERRQLLESDVIIAIQSAEARLLARLAPEREVITVGIDFPVAEEPDLAEERPQRLLIVGSGNPLNVHGLREFRLHAWPRIRRACPRAVVHVVGRVADAFQSDDDQFRLIGWIERMEHEWREASIVLNPTVAGTGLKVKSVEALSWGKPLVATRNAVEGIDFTGAPPFVECADWQDFAHRTIELLTSEDRRLGLGRRAHAWARAHLAAANVYAPLAEMLHRRLS